MIRSQPPSPKPYGPPSRAAWILAACGGGAFALLIVASLVLWGLRSSDEGPVPAPKSHADSADDVAAREAKEKAEQDEAIAKALAMPYEPPAPMPVVATLETPAETDAKMLMPLDEATFLGTQAKGRRFCIIADASNSMRGGPFVQLKSEILKTLGDLKPTSQFYVIFFNAADVPMPHPNWLPATKANIEKVRPWVQGMDTVLKTLPVSSFKRALELQPRPDVIFFMTDGQMAKTIPNEVARLNETAPKAIIHTIQFHKPNPKSKLKEAGAEDQLRRIAEQSGGTFRHFKSMP